MTDIASGSLVLLPEHEELRRSVRSFLERAVPETAVRATMETDTGFDEDVWRRLTSELGVAALLVPETLGGVGYGFVEVGVVLEEAGRALLPAPLFSTVVLATVALLRSGDMTAQKKYLPEIADGLLRATVAMPRDADTVTAERRDGGWLLTGDASFVLDGHTAGLVLVAATSEAGPTLFAVDGTATGLTRTLLSTMDQTRKLATLRFDGVAAEPVGAPGAADGVLTYVAQVAAVGLAAEQLGGAQKVLEMATDYVKTRYQFGRAIGSFQAVKHRCADMLVDVESARSMVVHALWCIEDDSPDLPQWAAMTKAFCSDAFLSCAGSAIQVHGGIGFTWEHPAHLYFKRAKSSQLLLGDPVHHRRVLADLLGL